jgi:hypothetical protein
MLVLNSFCHARVTNKVCNPHTCLVAIEVFESYTP